MIFDTPTTKQEMYEVLNDIYYYYHIKRVDYEGVTLTQLSLDRMVAEELTDQQLMAKAEEICLPTQSKTLMEYTDKLKDKIYELSLKKEEKENELTEKEEEIEKTYESAKTALNKTALKNGITDSMLYAEKIAELEKEKGEKIGEARAKINGQITAIEGRIDALEDEIDNAEEKYAEMFSAEVNAKFIELKDSQTEKLRQVFEYNNGLDEKEQRYANSIVQTKASMELRYIETRINGLTKDELVEMGYYREVINCVNAYYGTLSAHDAYADIKSESHLALYLDDYYENIVYFYKTNAT